MVVIARSGVCDVAIPMAYTEKSEIAAQKTFAMTNWKEVLIS